MIFLLLVVAPVSAQDSSHTKFFPSDFNFKPLAADHKEAKLGILYYTASTNLKVDVGFAADVVQFIMPSDKIKIVVGIEFLAYALSTSYEGKRLQIDAVDGLFGGYVSIVKSFSENKLMARLKIIHNSAHLVDGHYDNVTKTWLNDYEPVPFTRDYGELTIANDMLFNSSQLRYYGGVTYSTLIRPDDQKRWNFHLGIESSFENLVGKIFGENDNIFFAHHFYLNGTGKYEGNNHTMGGIKIGNWYGRGISFYVSYFKGFDVFNSYYKFKREKFGVGFKFDF
ncbi:MAG: DUF1207 domain-containing protein [Ignavibacteriales bacterium]|nr:MAG: DUF1207 domain-containing protein [Ignavibacteriales bacterium]